jgi:hypothetical protein
MPSKITDLPKPMQDMMEARQLWEAMLECCDADRAGMLKDKLEEYAFGAFMGEKNADVYVALISFAVEHAVNLGVQDDVDPKILSMAMQLGLQVGVQAYTTELENDNAFEESA